MSTVYIALGSNLEPRRQYMQQAVLHMQQIGKVLNVAPLYESEPYGFTEQPRFLNSAVCLETDWQPLPLLNRLKQIETTVGRITRQRWGPREIDLDIIFYDDLVLQTEHLTIPHPDYRNRCFVLQPLADIAPEFVPPDATQPLQELARECRKTNHLTHIQSNWVAV